MEIKDLYWVAGILEGEGCFTMRSENSKIYVVCKMTDRDVLEQLRDITGIGIIRTAEYFGYKKTNYVWEVNKQADASGLMMTLYPLMKSRRQDRIRECLESWRIASWRNPYICRRGHKKAMRGRCHVCDRNSRERLKEEKLYGV